MATLAHTLRWKDSRGDEGRGEAQTATWTEPELAHTSSTAQDSATADPYCLRPLPNEELYLYIKRFDNNGVVRQHDPQAGRVAWKAIGGSCIAATLLVGLLLPGAYRLLAGYQIDRLKQAHEQSLKELKTLEYEEARQINMDRMLELAKRKEFVPPTSDQVQFLQPKDSVASLQNPK